MHLYSLLFAAGVSLASTFQHPFLDEPDIANAFTIYQSDVSPQHSIRIKKQNATMCDAHVDQYTGWLDVGHKHFFFWYFESENAPSAATSTDSLPLALWLTGGPGGSSMLGLFQELGPCLINEHGNGTVYNPYGWNKDTAFIFVDQPAGVGFSYLDEGEPVPGDSFTSAEDMNLFLRIFVQQAFPHHSKGPLVLTGESYAGHYLPALGAEIVRYNTLHPRYPDLNLKSLAIGNGFVSPLDTTFGYWETLCTTNPGVKEPVFNETRCDIMAANMPRCIDLISVCYKHPDAAICSAAESICWDGVVNFYDGESGAGGRNRFDITGPCEIDDFCYPETHLINNYLNLTSSFAALGVPPEVKEFSVISWAVSDAFQLTGEESISLKPEVQFLLASQIDILIYQGNLDLACNTAGAKRWTDGMHWKGQTAFVAKSLKPWKSVVNGKEIESGSFKEVNIAMREGDSKTTRFALVTVDRAGHMVPQSQPDVALDLLTKWLAGLSFD